MAPADGWVAPKGLTPDGRVLATPGRRFLGYLVDTGIWILPQAVLITVAAVAIFAAASTAETNPDGTTDLSGSTILLIVGVYGAFFVLGLLRLGIEAELVARRGQTWGMKAMRLRAVDGRTGGSVTRGRAWGRALFASFISSQLFGIGFWWAFFDDRSRTLHDLVTTTVVLDER